MLFVVAALNSRFFARTVLLEIQTILIQGSIRVARQDFGTKMSVVFFYQLQSR